MPASSCLVAGANELKGGAVVGPAVTASGVAATIPAAIVVEERDCGRIGTFWASPAFLVALVHPRELGEPLAPAFAFGLVAASAFLEVAVHVEVDRDGVEPAYFLLERSCLFHPPSVERGRHAGSLELRKLASYVCGGEASQMGERSDAPAEAGVHGQMPPDVARVASHTPRGSENIEVQDL